MYRDQWLRTPFRAFSLGKFTDLAPLLFCGGPPPAIKRPRKLWYSRKARAKTAPSPGLSPSIVLCECSVNDTQKINQDISAKDNSHRRLSKFSVPFYWAQLISQEVIQITNNHKKKITQNRPHFYCSSAEAKATASTNT